MTPIRLNLDLRVRGVRVHLRPTSDAAHLKRLKRMLKTLGEVGRMDLVVDIGAGRLPIDDAWMAYRRGKLDEIPTADLLRSLSGAWAEWLAGKDIRARTRRDYQQALPRLLAFGTGALTPGDLPTLLAKHRTTAVGKRASTYNRDRRAVLVFLRATYGPFHYLTNAAVRLGTLKPVAAKVNPQSPEQVRTLATKLSPEHVRILWGLCLTGMRPSEFWEEDGASWRVEGDRVLVTGTKTTAAIRPVPKAGIVTKPDREQLAFRRALKKACVALEVKRVTLYDCRRTFSNWMADAGIPRNRRRAYMGHASGDVTDLYERPGDLTRWLAEDAAALARVIGYEGGLKLVKGGGR